MINIQQPLRCPVFFFFAVGPVVSFLCGTCCSDWRGGNEEGSYWQEIRCEGRGAEKDDRRGQSCWTHPFLCKTTICPYSLTDRWPTYNITSMSCELATCNRVWLAALTCGLASCSSAPPLGPHHPVLLIASPSWGQYVSQHGCKRNLLVTEREDFTVRSLGLCHNREKLASSHTRHTHPNGSGRFSVHRFWVWGFSSCSFLFSVFSR